MLISCEPGTSTAARWGSQIAISPAVPLVQFTSASGLVDLRHVAGTAPLTVDAWGSGKISATLPAEAPGTGPYFIEVTDGSIVHRGTIQVGDGVVPPSSTKIPIPTLLALFRLKKFAGSQGGTNGTVLLIGQADSPTMLDSDDSLAVKEALNAVLNNLDVVMEATNSGAANFTSYALGVDALVKAVPNQKKILSRWGDQDNLHDVLFYKQEFAYIDGLEDDTHAEDTASSLILIGPTGTKATLYNYRNHNSDGGALKITIDHESGAGAAVIEDLHTTAPKTTISGATVEQALESPRPSWGDRIGSLKLDAPQMAFDTQTWQVVPK